MTFDEKDRELMEIVRGYSNAILLLELSSVAIDYGKEDTDQNFKIYHIHMSELEYRLKDIGFFTDAELSSASELMAWTS